jgi:hypothetical protein
VAGERPASTRGGANSGEHTGTGVWRVLRGVFGANRTSGRRRVERRVWTGQTTTTRAGRCNAAEDRARRRCGLAYGDEHGEQRAREDGGKLTEVVAVKWARRRAGAGVGDGDRRRGSEVGDEACAAQESLRASMDRAGRRSRARRSRRTRRWREWRTVAAPFTVAAPWPRSGEWERTRERERMAEGKPGGAGGDALIHPRARARCRTQGEGGPGSGAARARGARHQARG